MRVRGWAVVVSVLSLLGLTGCPPTPRCDEKISDTQPIENAVLQNSTILEIGSTLKFRRITVSPCFVDGKVTAVVLYSLPASFSAYSAVYKDELRLAYAKEGTIELVNQAAGKVEPLSVGVVTVYFRDRVEQIEANPRVQELLASTGVAANNPESALMTGEVFRSGDNRLEYSFVLDLVMRYSLSNDRIWQAYPEIALAHGAIRNNLLVGDLAGCAIGTGEGHAYTTASGETEQGPWYITVALQCPDGWKDAFVQINKDGSFEKLAIQTEY